MDEEARKTLLTSLENMRKGGYTVTQGDIAEAKIELEVCEAQVRAAVASEKNAGYMLWSVIAAALSALAALATAVISLVWHQ